MTFEEILDHAMAMLQRRRRVTYRTFQRQSQPDDAALDDLKAQLLSAHPQVVDEAEQGLTWTGVTVSVLASALSPPMSCSGHRWPRRSGRVASTLWPPSEWSTTPCCVSMKTW